MVHPHSLPPATSQLQANVNTVITDSYSLRKLVTYKRHCAHLPVLLSNFSLPCDLHIPPQYSCMYAVFFSYNHALDYFKSVLAAVAKLHKFHSLPKLTHAFALQKILVGIEKSSTSLLKKFMPIYFNFLQQILALLPEVPALIPTYSFLIQLPFSLLRMFKSGRIP